MHGAIYAKIFSSKELNSSFNFFKVFSRIFNSVLRQPECMAAITAFFLFLYQISEAMKKWLLILLIISGSFFIDNSASAQCSICTKTAQQLGDKPAKALNTGIIYLALAPFLLVGFVGYKWWQKNKDTY